MLRFKLLQKDTFNGISKNIFAILANNMSIIAPTGNTFEEDYNIWYKGVSEGLKDDRRNIILAYFDELLIGFFQYYTNNNGLFMMEEIQILANYQGKNKVFRALYGFIFTILPENMKIVEAFVNKNNYKSQKILQHLGLQIVGSSKNGNSYHYKGDFDNLMKWYNHIQ